jgi:hypothetical protein
MREEESRLKEALACRGGCGRFGLGYPGPGHHCGDGTSISVRSGSSRRRADGLTRGANRSRIRSY